MKNINIKTRGMHCPSCEMLIIDSLEELNGVHKVKASHKSGIISISFDETKLSEQEVKETIKKENYKIIN